MFRSWYIPAQIQAFQLRELSRDEQWKLVQSFPLERRQNLLAEASLGEGFDFFWKGSSALSQLLLRMGRPPLTHLLLSLPFIGREEEKKEVSVGLEKDERGCWEMKEEGRELSKFPVFSRPASPIPHDPWGQGEFCLLACLLLINPWPALYGVAFRTVLGSQKHFREQSFTQEKRNKAGTVPLK